MRPNVRASAWTESESVPSLASFVPFLDLQPGKPAPTEWVRAGLRVLIASTRQLVGGAHMQAHHSSPGASTAVLAHWQIVQTPRNLPDESACLVPVPGIGDSPTMFQRCFRSRFGSSFLDPF